MTSIFEWLLDLLFPIACAGCRLPGTHCCQDCFSKIPTAKNPFAAAPPAAPLLDGVFAASLHKEKTVLAELIHRYKYDGAKTVARLLTKILEKPLADFCAGKHGAILKNAVLIPVPLHWRRKNMRNFNQSEILAFGIGKMLDAPVKNLLKRKRYTRPQAELGQRARLKNLASAFILTPEFGTLNSAQNYFLVDDVCTTGTTLNECAKVLKQHGAQKVYGMVVARTERY